MADREFFPDITSVRAFRDVVNEAGRQRPLGWVKGVGSIAPEAADPDEVRYGFRKYALAYVDDKTGIEEQYRRDCVRDLRSAMPRGSGGYAAGGRTIASYSGDSGACWMRPITS